MTEKPELSPKAVRVLGWMRKLLEKGFCQLRPSIGEAVCLMQAKGLALLHYGYPAFGEPGYSVDKALADAIGCGTGDLVAWNDEPGRTQEEVLRLLDGILARTRK